MSNDDIDIESKDSSDGNSNDDNNDDGNNNNEDGNNEDNNNEDNDNEDEEINKKIRPIKSDVWDFVDITTRKCPNCEKIFKKSTGTASIRTHLQNYGILLVKEKQTSLDHFVKRHSSKIQFEKTQKVIEWIVLDIQPFKVVEGEAFRKMITKLDPQYQIPSRETVKNAIKKSFEDRRKAITNYIKNISGKVSLTTDIWSSLKNEGFMGITIHFIDETWTLKHFTLDIFRFKGSHTAEAIANEIYNTLVEFELDKKSIAITTDNASNMIAGVRILKTKLNQNSFTYYRCIAHVLNLIVVAGLDIIKKPIKKLRNLIKVIQKSSKLLEELKSLMQVDKKPFFHPIIDCKTRWNSTLRMLNRTC